MIKKSIWYSLFTIATVSLVILAIGFYQAVMVTTGGSPQTPAQSPSAQIAGTQAKLPSKHSNLFQVFILGDSIAKGTGDENGKGFAGYLPELLKNDTPKKIVVTDAGIDGLESQGLLEELQNKRLDKAISGSDLILISIGGNDLKSILTLNDLSKEEAFNTRQTNYLANLKQTLKILRTNNPNALIVFLGLYNPFEKETTAEDVGLLNEWNYNTQQLLDSDSNTIFIPTFDLMKYNLGRYLAKDGLHPNSAGYQAISGRISKSVEMIVSSL